MKIDKDSILKAFIIFENVYNEFSKKIEDKENVKEMINTWIEVFETIDYDYENANKDFLEAVKIVSTRNKYIPTIAEIVEEMKKIYTERKKDKTKEAKAIDTSDLTQEEYRMLMQKKITIEELIEKGRVHVG